MSLPGHGGFRYQRAAALVRAQIADGTLRPGQPAPSGARLARVTGYSELTCRKALRALIADGTLIPGPTLTARPRIAVGPAAPGQHAERAGRELSTALTAARRAAGLTQPALATVAGCSVTTVGHAETGRLWQSRRFWERADKALDACGELLVRYDAYQAAVAADGAVPAGFPGGLHSVGTVQGDCPGEPPVQASPVPAAVTIVWSDGTETTVYPPAP